MIKILLIYLYTHGLQQPYCYYSIYFLLIAGEIPIPYLTLPSQLSQLCHVDTRLLLFNCLYEARNPSLYQSLAITCGYTYRKPPLLHLGNTSMSAYDYLPLGYFLSWVCCTVSRKISVHLELINDTCAKFLLKGFTEGIRETKRCGGGIVGSLSIQLDCRTWKYKGMHYLSQLLRLSEGIYVSGLKLYDCQLTHQDFLCLAEVVGRSMSISVLKLLYISLTKESRLAFGKMLQRNTILRTLRIATTFHDTEFITDIAEGLKHNEVLTTVEFQGCISNIGLKSLAEVISYNKQLKTLMITFTIESVCGYSADGIVYLIEALKHNSTLEYLCLYDTLTVQQLELLANTLTINTTLEKLDYESKS